MTSAAGNSHSQGSLVGNCMILSFSTVSESPGKFLQSTDVLILIARYLICHCLGIADF